MKLHTAACLSIRPLWSV